MNTDVRTVIITQHIDQYHKHRCYERDGDYLKNIMIRSSLEEDLTIEIFPYLCFRN